jgi:lactate dehydrogenase-like 2-hydroxyacid dehydrogenase
MIRPERMNVGQSTSTRIGKATWGGIYAIVGFGAIGQALARMFARKGIEVAVASRHQPEVLAPQANAIGPTTVPKTLKDAASRGREGTGKLEGQDCDRRDERHFPPERIA